MNHFDFTAFPQIFFPQFPPLCVSLLKNSLSPLLSSLDPSTKCLPSTTASLSSTPKLSLLCLPHFPSSPSFSLCFVTAFDDGTRDRPYGPCLVAEINKYPNKVMRKDSSKKTAKKSCVMVFVKLGFNYDEIPELCNTLPALELCYSMSQKFMDEQQKLPENAEAATTDSFSSVASSIANGRLHEMASHKKMALQELETRRLRSNALFCEEESFEEENGIEEDGSENTDKKMKKHSLFRFFWHGMMMSLCPYSLKKEKVDWILRVKPHHGFSTLTIFLMVNFSRGVKNVFLRDLWIVLWWRIEVEGVKRGVGFCMRWECWKRRKGSGVMGVKSLAVFETALLYICRR